MDRVAAPHRFLLLDIAHVALVLLVASLASACSGTRPLHARSPSTPVVATAASTQVDDRVRALALTFAREYSSLKIPEFERGYRENLAAIPAIEQIAWQQRAFDGYAAQLASIDPHALSPKIAVVHEILAYEIAAHQERFALELDYREHAGGEAAPLDGLHELRNGDRWYRFYLKVSASTDVTPEEVASLGESEVARVTEEIRKVQALMGFAGDDARRVRWTGCFFTRRSPVITTR